MPADRLLQTLLRSLQTYTDQQDTPRLVRLHVGIEANPLSKNLDYFLPPHRS